MLDSEIPVIRASTHRMPVPITMVPRIDSAIWSVPRRDDRLRNVMKYTAPIMASITININLITIKVRTATPTRSAMIVAISIWRCLPLF